MKMAIRVGRWRFVVPRVVLKMMSLMLLIVGAVRLCATSWIAMTVCGAKRVTLPSMMIGDLVPAVVAVIAVEEESGRWETENFRRKASRRRTFPVANLTDNLRLLRPHLWRTRTSILALVVVVRLVGRFRRRMAMQCDCIPRLAVDKKGNRGEEPVLRHVVFWVLTQK